MSHSNQFHNSVAGFPVSGSITVSYGLARKLADRPIENIDRHTAQDPPDPLYLFYCGLQWRRHADSSAGWELIGWLRSSQPRVKDIAASLLAKTQHMRLRRGFAPN